MKLGQTWAECKLKKDLQDHFVEAEFVQKLN